MGAHSPVQQRPLKLMPRLRHYSEKAQPLLSEWEAVCALDRVAVCLSALCAHWAVLQQLCHWNQLCLPASFCSCSLFSASSIPKALSTLFSKSCFALSKASFNPKSNPPHISSSTRGYLTSCADVFLQNPVHSNFLLSDSHSATF